MKLTTSAPRAFSLLLFFGSVSKAQDWEALDNGFDALTGYTTPLEYVDQQDLVDLPDFEFPAQYAPEPVPRDCPAPCDQAGPIGISWPHVDSIESFASCNQTVLLELLTPAASTSLDTAAAATDIRACAASSSNKVDYGPPCVATAKLIETTVDVEIGWWHSDAKTLRANQLVQLARDLRKSLAEDPTCRSTSTLARYGNTTLGIYVGAEIRKSTTLPLLDRFIEFAGQQDASLLPSQFAAQICGPQGNRSATHGWGLMYDTSGKIEGIHSALRGWLQGECLSGFEDGDRWVDQKIGIIPAVAITMGADAVDKVPSNNATFGNKTSITSRRTHHLSPVSLPRNDDMDEHHHQLFARAAATCTPYTVVSGDDCWSIYTNKCKVSRDDFYKWNGGGSDAFCRTLQPGDVLCCSAGDKPNNDPKPNPDGTCQWVQVQSGDSCWSIADQRCTPGISTDQLTKYNGGSSSSFCNNLKLRSVVCCSPGDKPDLRPQKKANGECATHFTADGDTCFTIREQYYLDEGELDKFNKGKTWGWTGCDLLFPGMNICVSEGDPPMPAPLERAVCGPRVKGTQRPTNGTKLADLNPCPLNVCCNIWGQCGTTDDFCIDTTVDGTPGTAKKGTHGCISNCGMDIVRGDPPASFGHIGYFEGWNKNRKCLHMDVTSIGAPYTIIHFAFLWITEDFQITAQGVEEQFEKFKSMKNGIKKVISFGGWAFSNESPTSHIIRRAVRPENIVRFVNNVVAFVETNGLDGVDFDWEYPGADDIQGSDPGTAEDGPNYLDCLKRVKRRLGTSKTVSFAAPASYWYLRHFPIKEMGDVADYLVYMTYDLHGQWDVDNKWSMEGCPAGNCLRSHVNKTSTYNALAMITKAGVPSNKIFVGITSYGRSFKMAEPGCTGPDCTFLGERNKSPAAPGFCTGEAGYISEAEIRQIRLLADTTGQHDYYQYYDGDSDSDILVYDSVEWVAFMDTETKARRIDEYKSMNFGGVSDWAVDLQQDASDLTSGDDGDGDQTGMMDLSYDCRLGTTYDSLDALDAVAADLPNQCAAMHAIKVLKKMLASSLDGYGDAASGYDNLFGFYADYIKNTLNENLRAAMLDKDKPLAGFFECYADLGQLGKRERASEVNCKDLPTKYMQSYTFFWELHDEPGFHKELSKMGLDHEWIQWAEHETSTDCSGVSQPGACFEVVRRHVGFPVGKDHIDVPNPKEVIEQAAAGMHNISAQYDLAYAEIGLELWDGDLADAVEVLSVPVFLLEDAVESMKEVKKIGAEYKKEQEKALILKIVEGILFLIPFVGAAIGGIGRAGAAIARMLMAVEGAAGAALGVYAIIEDPDLAPIAILTMFLGGLGSAATPGMGRKYRTLADGKSRMSKEQQDAMGASFKKNDPKVKSIMGKVCPGRNK